MVFFLQQKKELFELPLLLLLQESLSENKKERWLFFPLPAGDEISRVQQKC